MKVAKLPWLTLILLTVAITLAAGCSRAAAPPTGGVPVGGTPPDRGLLSAAVRALPRRPPSPSGMPRAN